MGPHGWQHARLPCPSLSLRICSVSCPLYRWCHPIILWWLDTSYLKCCAGPQSPYGLGPICRSIAFDAGKFPDKLQTLTSFPKSPRAESKCADALASYSKTSPSCRIFWRVWFQSKEFWAYTPLTPTLLHAEIKKKNLISFRAVGIWTQQWRSTDLMFVLAGKSVFLEDTHQGIWCVASGERMEIHAAFGRFLWGRGVDIPLV